MKRKKDRKVRKGIDYEKLAKIWSVLESAGTWLHVAEISRRTGINECTVRYYLDHHLYNAIEQERISPTIKLRLVKLKPNLTLTGYIKSLEIIKKIKNRT